MSNADGSLQHKGDEGLTKQVDDQACMEKRERLLDVRLAFEKPN